MFGVNLPTDNCGYVHLTTSEWVKAGYNKEEGKKLAKKARKAVEIADAAIERWRNF